MKAISIRQPWCWAILRAGKRVENRSWPWSPKYRGPVLLHAAVGCTRAEYEESCEWMRHQGLACWHRWSDGWSPRVPSIEDLDRGGIVGRARLVGAITAMDTAMKLQQLAPTADSARLIEALESPWYTGALGLVLADVEPIEFCRYKGALGLFDVPDDLPLRSAP